MTHGYISASVRRSQLPCETRNIAHNQLFIQCISAGFNNSLRTLLLSSIYRQFGLHFRCVAMADIAALTLAVIDVSIRTFTSLRRFRRRWREAPAEIASIAEGVDDLRELLYAINRNHTRLSTNAELVGLMTKSVNKCCDVLLEIEALVESNDGQDWGNRCRWAADGHARAKDLLDRLTYCRQILHQAQTTCCV
jgi:hypothetical protein